MSDIGPADERAEEALAWLARRLLALTHGRVLDLGCGEGRFLPPYGVGLDIDASRLPVARTRSPLVVRADARELPFAGAAFDTVYAHRMLNDTGDVDRVLTEVVRVLRPGGRLLVFTRARTAEGDRLDRQNGTERLGRHFSAVAIETPAGDQRAALFIAERPRATIAGRWHLDRRGAHPEEQGEDRAEEVARDAREAGQDNDLET